MGTSAGLLLYRRRGRDLEVLLVHPGGPYWAKKDAGAWSIPKGDVGDGEGALDAAKREFEEETGCIPPQGPYRFLGALRQKSGKSVQAWAVPGSCDPGAIRSNTFLLEWPPRSGREREFPEIDRAAWFGLAEASRKLVPGQRAFLDALHAAIEEGPERA